MNASFNTTSSEKLVTNCCSILSSTKNISSSSSSTIWLFDMNEIAEGKSTILGGNKIAFYGVHCSGLIIILISLISCSSVIINMIRNTKRTDRWDFSDRFPLYLAVSDVLWALSNISGDHVILMIKQEYPSKFVASLLATNLYFFFCYQQLMNAGLSLYTYLKVVKRVAIGLGYCEWRLHATVITLILIQIAIYWYFQAFGNGGFWFLIDLGTHPGRILGGIVCFTASLHAALTLFAYRSIQNVISDHKRVFSHYHSPEPSTSGENQLQQNFTSRTRTYGTGVTRSTVRINSYIHQQTYSTATNCLTTFIYISLCLYIPLALVCWVGWSFACFGYIEPFSAFGVTVWANSGGWVNALGYFHNRKIKAKRRARVNDITGKNSNSFSLQSK